jgi:hypothetical protein
MTKTQAETILDNGVGIDVKQSTPLGTRSNKNGRWGKGGKEKQALTYFLRQDMELVVLANSPVGSPPTFFRKVVTDPYLVNVKPSWTGLTAAQRSAEATSEQPPRSDRQHAVATRWSGH